MVAHGRSLLRWMPRYRWAHIAVLAYSSLEDRISYATVFAEQSRRATLRDFRSNFPAMSRDSVRANVRRRTSECG